MINMTLEINKSPKGLSRKFSRARKTGGQSFIDYIKEEILPKKFTQQGEREYNYEPRSLSYKKRKERLGITEPLVYSGQLKRAVLEEQNTDERVTNKYITLKLKGLPKHAFYGTKKREISEIQEHILKYPTKPLLEVARDMSKILKRYVTLGEVIRESENRGSRAGTQPNIKNELLTKSRTDVKMLTEVYKRSALVELDKPDQKKQIIK